ncbi:MAG: SO_0444 family Cu/Zn efflux transporter [Planctomycetota bacterium]
MIDVILSFLNAVWHVVVMMAPSLLFGFFAAGILYVYIPKRLIEKTLSGDGMMPVVKATIFGIPIPLCSCGVLPVTASLRANGASKGAATAFMITTPQTGVDSIAVTYQLLGGLFAAFRVVAALVSGILTGLFVNRWAKDAPGESAPQPLDGDHSHSASGDCCAKDGAAACCAKDVVHTDHSQEGLPASRPSRPIIAALRYAFVTLPRDIGKSLAVGILIAALIDLALPDGFFSKIFDSSLTGRMAQMAAMLAVGIPMYICSTSSVPVAAAMILKGVSPGAALVFLMTGPASNAAALTTSVKILGKRATVIYLATLAATAFAAGLIVDAAFPAIAIPAAAQMAHHHSIIDLIAAVGLILLIVTSLLPKRTIVSGGDSPRVEGKENNMSQDQKMTLSVKGMNCSHCVAAVTDALAAASPGCKVDVNLDAEEAVVAGKTLPDRALLITAIERLGYSAE